MTLPMGPPRVAPPAGKDIVSQIVTFLQSKGLSDTAIAGVLGNIQQESGFNTGASNTKEGAIGLAQWEGGRRTALQKYASAHGLSETSLQAQLGYMWQELSGDYKGVLQSLKTANSAGQAAAIWDGDYEKSAGTSRTQRQANAQAFLNNGLSSSGLKLPAAGGGSSLGAGMSAPEETLAQKEDAIALGAGPLYQLAQSIPELKTILLNAISKGLTATEFANQIENTKWYRTHADTVRTQIALAASDPATYKQNIANEKYKIQQEANALGVTLSANSLNTLSEQSLLWGWSDQTLQQKVGSYWDIHNATGTPAGQAAATEIALKQTAYNYGIPVSQQAINSWTQKILAGQATADGFTAYAVATAKSMYPAVAKQLDSMDMKTIADPYVQTKANLLEVDPGSINWANDPSIKKALQGTGSMVDPTTGKPTTGEPTATPMWQFEQQVKADPKWQYTVNAHTATAGILDQLGKDWGYNA